MRKAADSTFLPTATRQAPGWRGTAKHDHFVQFYHTSDFLIECLAGFAADGLWKGDRVIVIATPEHRAALEIRLRLKGIDVGSGLATGQMLALDAQEILAKFMVDGRPDPEAFREVIGEVIEKAGKGRHVRAFGEMVALLWKGGQRAAALELEHLWNELSRRFSFSLYCAYPAACATPSADGISLDHICSAHSCVLTASG